MEQTVEYVEISDSVFANLMRDDPRLVPSARDCFTLTEPQQEAVRALKPHAKTALLPHQQTGLMWMLQHANVCRHGGLVLDDAGMGKSLMLIWYVVVQQLAMAAQKKPGAVMKPAVVLVPPNLCSTWMRQFQTHFDVDAVLQQLQLAVFCCSSDHPVEEFDEATDLNAELWRLHEGPCVLVMSDTKASSLLFHRNKKLAAEQLIIDEAHHMQSLTSQRFQGCRRLAAKVVWCVTATPVVNSLLELFPLLLLCRVAPFLTLRRGLETFYEFLPQIYHDRLEKTNKIKQRWSSQHHHQQKEKEKEKPKRLTPQEEKTRLTRLVDNYLVPHALRRSKVSLDMPPIRERAALVEPFEVEERVYRLMHRTFKQFAGALHNTRLQHVVLEWIHLLRLCASHYVLALAKVRQWCAAVLDTPRVALDRAQKVTIAAAEILKRDLCDVFQNLNVDVCDMVFSDDPSRNPDNQEDADDEDGDREMTWVAPPQQQLRKQTIYWPAKFVFIRNELAGVEQGKSMVVSQWLAVAKQLASALTTAFPDREVFFVDGTMPVARRQRVLDAFAASKDARAVLVTTLRSVNEGFTIVCATRMYLVDSWWNNTLEYQLFNRIYRVGQREAVDVCQLYLQESIETKIRVRKLQKFNESLSSLGFAQGVLGDAAVTYDYVSLFA